MHCGCAAVRCRRELTRRVALWTANLAKRGKRVKNADDVDETRTVLEKRTGGKAGGELSPMDPAKGL